ncbi:MAG: pentapeptide repeat-containing protein [Cyanobacteria bacterium J06638_6]
MRRQYFALFLWLSALLITAPALAEPPAIDLQTTNARRLLILNSCPGCDLSWVDLQGADLTGADLRQADLTGADLSGADLTGVNLAQANLTATNFTGALLNQTRLVGADLDYANFTEAQLYSVDVTGASLDNLNLLGAIVVDTPIGIGGSDGEGDIPPVISPEEVWQLHPPSVPLYPPAEIIDVPEQVLPLS